MSDINNEAILESIKEEVGYLVSVCCGATPFMGMEETGICGACRDHTRFEWEADEDEVQRIFEERSALAES